MDTTDSRPDVECLPRSKGPDSDAEAVSELLRKIGEGEVDPQELLKRICHEPDSEKQVGKPDEDQISTLTALAREKLERTGDVTRAVEYALEAFEGNISGDRKQVMERVAQEVNATLPDQFEYDVVWDSDLGAGIAVKTGCPHCGQNRVFNGAVTYGAAQFVAMDVDESELQAVDGDDIGDSTSVCFIDDSGISIDHLTCGLCGAVLEEN